MLPVPGAQGITEAMYKKIFRNIFPQQCLIASMCITRGISFYFIMAVSFGVWGIAHLKKNKNKRKGVSAKLDICYDMGKGKLMADKEDSLNIRL